MISNVYLYLDELISIDVQSIAFHKALSTTFDSAPRKNSDDDYYVEETLLFTYLPK